MVLGIAVIKVDKEGSNTDKFPLDFVPLILISLFRSFKYFPSIRSQIDWVSDLDKSLI